MSNSFSVIYPLQRGVSFPPPQQQHALCSGRRCSLSQPLLRAPAEAGVGWRGLLWTATMS